MKSTPARKLYARGGSQTFRIKFNPGQIAQIDRIVEVFQDKFSLKVSRSVVLTLALTALVKDIARLHGIDVDAVVNRVVSEFRA